MADIHIHRKHALGLAKAREIAFNWAEDVEKKLDMACTYEEGKTEDCVSFTRSGVNGTLMVTKDGFELTRQTRFFSWCFQRQNRSGNQQKFGCHCLQNLLLNQQPKPAAKKAESKKA